MFRALRRYLLVTLLVVLPTQAQDKDERRTLKGLQSIHVRVLSRENGPLDAANLEVLRATAELRLRQNGIKVLDEPDVAQGHPVLTISFAFYDIGKSDSSIQGYAVNVLCQLEQDVHLDRNKSPARAFTWVRGVVGTTNSRALQNSTKDQVSELLDLFVNDLLAENAR